MSVHLCLLFPQRQFSSAYLKAWLLQQAALSAMLHPEVYQLTMAWTRKYA